LQEKLTSTTIFSGSNIISNHQTSRKIEEKPTIPSKKKLKFAKKKIWNKKIFLIGKVTPFWNQN
jgi:hypothetical protein